MRKASFVVDAFYQGNRVFDLQDPVMNRDDVAYPFHLMKEVFAERGVDFSTCDINPPGRSDFVIYIDMPRKLVPGIEPRRSFLLAIESPLVRPANFDVSLHDSFARIFTWNDSFVDGSKYVKINYSFRFPEPPPRRPFADSGLACMIAANKRSDFPGELYSKRLEIIRWFEANHPGEFDLFGVGWDRYYFGGGPITRRLNRIGWLSKAMMADVPSYKGKVASKSKVMGGYRFAFALENYGAKGYVTEKIFDCIFAGCVPVYLGAPDIADRVHRDAFVDMREYDDLPGLRRSLASMGEAEWARRREAAQEYLRSEVAAQFTAAHFARTVVDGVLGAPAGTVAEKARP